MFVKLNKSGGHTYLQLAESFRDDAGQPRNRVIATLGRIDALDGKLDSVLNGLLRATGRAEVGAAPSVEFESARALGDVWALQNLWEQVGFDELTRIFRRTRRRGFDAEQMLRVMVFNRLCDPTSKLGILRWLRTVSLPKIDVASITHAHLLRAMDDWIEHEDQIQQRMAGFLRPLIDTELSVVFYDLTTIEVYGETELTGDVRAYGRSKRDTIDRQFALGLVQTADGLPIAYEVFEGNVAETTTLMPMVTKVAERFKVSRVVLVADRGLLSMDNLEQLCKCVLPGGQPLEFILAVPARRYTEFAPIVEKMGSNQPTWVAHCSWLPVEGVERQAHLRLVVAHDSKQGELATKRRRDAIAELEALGAKWAGKLEGQEIGVKARGRKLSNSGAKARFYHAVAEAHLSSVIQVDMKDELFTYTVNEKTLQRLEALDGKLVVLTNVTDLDAQATIDRYKSLADIERGFRVLKSEIEIGPVFHRLPQRIRAHAGICFMALVLYRVMRMRLHKSDTGLSPTRAIELLREIQHHRVTLNGAKPVEGISRIDALHSRLMKALDIPQPNLDIQLPLPL